MFKLVLEFLFSDPETERVVVEPDIRNAKVHALKRRAGFRYQRPVALPTKHAHLAFCTRAHYRAAIDCATAPRETSPIDQLSADVWNAVNRGLIRKAIAEFAHERLLAPECVRSGDIWSEYQLHTDRPDVSYHFRARRLSLDHRDLDAASITKSAEGRDAQLDAMELVLEFKSALELSDDVLPVYLEEIASTLFAAAYKRAHQVWSAADLVHAEWRRAFSSRVSWRTQSRRSEFCRRREIRGQATALVSVWSPQPSGVGCFTIEASGSHWGWAGTTR